MRTLQIFSLAIVSVIVVLIGFTACDKDPSTIGVDLVDDNQLFVGDTAFTLFAFSSKEDSVVSDETSLNLVGSMRTVDFGRTNASFYTHLRLGDILPSFGENPQGDSAILSLVYSGYYGNINSMQTVSVNLVSETFYQDSTYYSNRELLISDTIFSNYSFIPNPTDSVMLPDSSMVAAELHIPLNEDFLNMILYPNDTNVWNSNDVFLEYFKGIYVSAQDVTSPGEGAIYYLDLLNPRSKVTIYYNDSLEYDLEFNSNTARVGRFEHDHSLSLNQNFLNQIVNNDSSAGTQNLYLQGLAGVQTTVKFPGLNEWVNTERYVINEARLIIPVEGESEQLPPPSNLVLFKLNEEGEILFMEDQQEGDNYFGGSLSETDNSYLFRISLYIQDLLAGTPDYGLRFYPSSKTVKANEAVLYGTDPLLSDRIRLELIFTDIE